MQIVAEGLITSPNFISLLRWEWGSSLLGLHFHQTCCKGLNESMLNRRTVEAGCNKPGQTLSSINCKHDPLLYSFTVSCSRPANMNLSNFGLCVCVCHFLHVSVLLFVMWQRYWNVLSLLEHSTRLSYSSLLLTTWHFDTQLLGS